MSIFFLFVKILTMHAEQKKQGKSAVLKHNLDQPFCTKSYKKNQDEPNTAIMSFKESNTGP